MMDLFNLLLAQALGGGGGGGTLVYVSPTGTSTDRVMYITIDGIEYKMGMGIVNNLTSTSIDDALSANMGRSLKDSVDGIDVLIPDQATSSNQLADKNFVNSSIGTNTAYYIHNDGNPFTSLAQLQAYSGTVTNNDYAFITGTDEQGNTYYDRYKATVNGSTVTWAKEYRLNNSSFTAVQWSTIQSGLTSVDKTKLDGIETGAQVNDLDGVQINGTDLTITSKKVNIPIAGESNLGVVRVMTAYGIDKGGSGQLAINRATDNDITTKVNIYKPIVPANLDKAVMEGLGNNSLTWTDAYKTSARNTIGAGQVNMVEYTGSETSYTENTLYYVVED